LHGIALLVIVAVSIAAAGFALGRNSYWREGPRRLAAHLGDDLANVTNDKLQPEVERLGKALGVELSVFDEEGRRLAGTEQGPPPLPRRAVARLSNDPDGSLRGHLGGAANAGPGRYVHLSIHPSEAEMLVRGLAILLVVVGALAIASAPLARAIVRPVERLTETARQLGEGDLKARSGLVRRDEIGELARVFDEMADRLERLVAGQRELMANVSHELRTPLARIRVTLGLAQETPDRLPAYLKEIESDTLELERLVSDVLTAARLDATGLGALHRERIPSQRFVEERVQRFTRLHPTRRLETGGEPLDLWADPSLLGRAIDNLLDNAAKYSEPPTPITLSVRQAEGGIEIKVVDEGIGITPEDLEHAFTPFFRADKSRTRSTGGAGLGLALSKRIVESHAGRITLESLPARGTTARVWLPPTRT
jgi:signal transduction histidine kinase